MRQASATPCGNFKSFLNTYSGFCHSQAFHILMGITAVRSEFVKLRIY